MINNEQNANLVKVPEFEEVKVVVVGMNLDGAAGPDGFGGHFYSSC